MIAEANLPVWSKESANWFSRSKVKRPCDLAFRATNNIRGTLAPKIGLDFGITDPTRLHKLNSLPYPQPEYFTTGLAASIMQEEKTENYESKLASYGPLTEAMVYRPVTWLSLIHI